MVHAALKQWPVSIYSDRQYREDVNWHFKLRASATRERQQCGSCYRSVALYTYLQQIPLDRGGSPCAKVMGESTLRFYKSGAVELNEAGDAHLFDLQRAFQSTVLFLESSL